MPKARIEKARATSAKGQITATAQRAFLLLERLRKLPTQEALRILIQEEFKGEISLVSSFGAESAALLHMVAQVDPATPVIFMDTGKLFGETKRYKKKLLEKLGLTDLRTMKPDPLRLKEVDPQGILWNSDANMCCWARKVEPMQRALEGWSAWISGRKRFQSSTRRSLEIVEAEGVRIKVNPLAYWSKQDIEDYFERFGLPRHPLVMDGYLSIGCMPCTSPVKEGEDERSGRWQGKKKVECGLHFIGQGAPTGVERPLDALTNDALTNDGLTNDGLAQELPTAELNALDDVLFSLPVAGKGRTTPVAQPVLVTERADRYGHQGGVLWMTGISESGKTLLAMLLQRQLFDDGALVFTLDEESVRQGLNDDLGFSAEEDRENIRRLAETAKLFADAGHIVLATSLSPRQRDRDQAREIVGESFHEVYLKADARDCAKDDPKVFYQNMGEIDHFTGAFAAYEEPMAAELVIDGLSNDLEQSLVILKSYLDDKLKWKTPSVVTACSG